MFCYRIIAFLQTFAPIIKMSWRNLVGKPTANKGLLLPTALRRKIAEYVKENFDADADEHFFWAHVNLKFVKPAVILLISS